MSSATGRWKGSTRIYGWMRCISHRVCDKVRQNHRVVSLALVIAIGINNRGERELLGFALGGSETEAFWLEFLRSLVQRGLKGVQLVISDAHEGLKAAIAQVAEWSELATLPGAFHAQSALACAQG